MQEAQTQLNLIQKLAKIRAIADVATKDRRGFNYSYADITDILAKVKSGMARYGVSLIPSIVPGTAQVSQSVTVNTKMDKTGKPYDQTVTEMLYQADMVFAWVDDASGEKIEVPWTATGMQSDPSQAFGSAMTYCTRYFLTNYFQIPQVAADDVDTYRSKQKEADTFEDKAIADEIISRFDVLLRQYLADHPEQSDAVKSFLSRYAKSADYRKIHEPRLAAKLLEDFQAAFLKEGA